jgi:hypothetical protein
METSAVDTPAFAATSARVGRFDVTGGLLIRGRLADSITF